MRSIKDIISHLIIMIKLNYKKKINKNKIIREKWIIDKIKSNKRSKPKWGSLQANEEEERSP